MTLKILILALCVLLGSEMGCLLAIKKVQPCAIRDYQLELTSDSIFIYDGNRPLGSLPWDNSPIDSVLLIDNQ